MGHSHGRRWTEAQIEAELLLVVAEVGRMPTMGELRDRGLNALGCKISRTGGGFRGWAAKLGVELRGTETHRGQVIETVLMQWLLERQFFVERQTTKCVFDLLVNGLKVDVKSAAMSTYVNVTKKGPKTCNMGHVFGIYNNNGAKTSCVDVYVLCGVNASGGILWRYFIPEPELRVHMVTITPNGKYSRFREDLSVLQLRP